MMKGRNDRGETHNYLVRVRVDRLQQLAEEATAARSQARVQDTVVPFMGLGDMVDFKHLGKVQAFFGEYHCEDWVQRRLPSLGIANGQKEVLVSWRGGIPRKLFERVDNDSGMYIGMLAPEEEEEVAQPPRATSQELSEKREAALAESNRLAAKAADMQDALVTAQANYEAADMQAEGARDEKDDAAVGVALAVVAHSEAEDRLAATQEEENGLAAMVKQEEEARREAKQEAAPSQESVPAPDTETHADVVARLEAKCYERLRLEAEEARLKAERDRADCEHQSRLAAAIAATTQARSLLKLAVDLRFEREEHRLVSMQLESKSRQRLDRMVERQTQLEALGVDYVDLDEDDDDEFEAVLRLTGAVQKIEAVFRRIARDCVDIMSFFNCERCRLPATRSATLGDRIGGEHRLPAK